MNHLSKYLILLSLFLGFHTYSQKKKIDSLKNELILHQQKDTNKVNVLNELAYLYRNKDFNKTINYLERSKSLADSLKYIKGKAKGIYIKGIVQRSQSKIDKGFQYINEALLLYKKINNKLGIAKCYNSLGILYYYKGNKKEAIQFYNKALTIYEEINNKIRVAFCFNNLGAIYSDKGNYLMALDYYNQSFNIAEKNNHTDLMNRSLGNIGSIYFYQENYDKAESIYEKLLKNLKNSDKKTIARTYSNLGLIYKEKKSLKKAFETLNKAVIIYKEINNEFDLTSPLNNIGDVFLEQGKYNFAYQYFKKATKIGLKVKNQRALCVSYLGLAKIYVNQKQYNNALNNALQSKTLSNKLDLLNYQRDVQQLLSKIYSKIGNYKQAYISHQEFKKLNDSIFNKKNIEKIAQLESEYKYKQELDSAKIKELQLAETVKIASKNLEKSQQNLLIGIIIFLILLLILGFYVFILKYKNIKTKAQNIITEQKLLRSQMTPHFIFNSLSVLQGMILNNEQKNAISYLSKFSKLLRTVLENSRYKKVLLIDELKAIESFMALQNLAINPPYNYNLTIDPEIDKSKLKIPPMLIQPFIENAIEHAFPNKKKDKEINIKISFEEQKLFCRIEDNGIGINLDTQKHNKDKSSLATTITSERLKMLSKEFKTSGSIEVKNKNIFGQQGTIVTLIIPYKKEAA